MENAEETGWRWEQICCSEECLHLSLGLWSLLPHTFQAETPLAEVVGLLKRFWTTLIGPTPLSLIQAFVEEQVELRRLAEATALRNRRGRASLTLFCEKGLDFGSFFSLLIDLFCAAVLEISPQKFVLFYETLLAHGMSKENFKVSIEDFATLSSGAKVILVEERFESDFKELLTQSWTASPSHIGLAACTYITQIVNGDCPASLKKLAEEEKTFFVFFSIRRGENVLKLTPAVHLKMRFAKASSADNGNCRVNVGHETAWIETAGEKNLKLREVFEGNCTVEPFEMAFQQKKGAGRSPFSLRALLSLSREAATVFESPDSKKKEKFVFQNFLPGIENKLQRLSVCTQEPLSASEAMMDYAARPSFVVAIYGRPLSGKSTLATGIANRFQLPLIDCDTVLVELLNKEEEEAPETRLLRAGEILSAEFVMNVIKDKIASIEGSAGYVLELSGALNNPHMLRIFFDFLATRPNSPSAFVELDSSVNDFHYRLSCLQATEKGRLLSLDDQLNRMQQSEKNASDTQELFAPASGEWDCSEADATRSLLSAQIARVGVSYKKFNCAFLSASAVLTAALDFLQPLWKPRPVALEPSEDLNSLLTDRSSTLPLPTLSPFNTVDPVALSQGHLLEGTPTNACLHLNCLYLFASEANRQSFLAFPERFTAVLPNCRGQFNLSLFTGKECRELGRKLAEKLGLEVISLADFIPKQLEGEGRLHPQYLGHAALREQLRLGGTFGFKCLPALLHASRGRSLVPLLEDTREDEEDIQRQKKNPQVSLDRLRPAELLDPEGDEDPAGLLRGFLFLDFPCEKTHWKLLSDSGIKVRKAIWFGGQEETRVEVEEFLGSENFKTFPSNLDSVSALAQALNFADPFKEKPIFIDSFDSSRAPNICPAGGFCAYSLSQFNRLVPGRKDCSLLWGNSRFFFVNETMRTHFASVSPQAFIRPPDRFFIVREPGTRAGELAKHLAGCLQSSVLELFAAMREIRRKELNFSKNWKELRNGFVSPQEHVDLSSEVGISTEQDLRTLERLIAGPESVILLDFSIIPSDEQLISASPLDLLTAMDFIPYNLIVPRCGEVLSAQRSLSPEKLKKDWIALPDEERPEYDAYLQEAREIFDNDRLQKLQTIEEALETFKGAGAFVASLNAEKPSKNFFKAGEQALEKIKYWTDKKWHENSIFEVTGDEETGQTLEDKVNALIESSLYSLSAAGRNDLIDPLIPDSSPLRCFCANNQIIFSKSPNILSEKYFRSEKWPRPLIFSLEPLSSELRTELSRQSALKFSSLPLFLEEARNCSFIDRGSLSLCVFWEKLSFAQTLSDEEKVFAFNMFWRSGLAPSGALFECFPENCNQAELLAQLGIVPTIVLGGSNLSQVGFLYARSYQNLLLPNVLCSPFLAAQLVLNSVRESCVAEKVLPRKLRDHKPVDLSFLRVSRAWVRSQEHPSGGFQCLQNTVGQALILGKPRFWLKGKVWTSEKILEGQPSSSLIEFDLPLSLLLCSQTHKDFPCPLCLAEKRYVEGSAGLQVRFAGKLRAFCSLNHLRCFLQNPRLFASLQPDEKQRVRVLRTREETSLEKQLVSAIIKAMHQVTGLRMRCPGLTLRQTSLVLLALLVCAEDFRRSPDYRREMRRRAESLVELCLFPRRMRGLTNKVLPAAARREVLAKFAEEYALNRARVQMAADEFALKLFRFN